MSERVASQRRAPDASLEVCVDAPALQPSQSNSPSCSRHPVQGQMALSEVAPIADALGKSTLRRMISFGAPLFQGFGASVAIGLFGLQRVRDPEVEPAKRRCRKPGPEGHAFRLAPGSRANRKLAARGQIDARCFPVIAVCVPVVGSRDTLGVGLSELGAAELWARAPFATWAGRCDLLCWQARAPVSTWAGRMPAPLEHRQDCLCHRRRRAPPRGDARRGAKGRIGSRYGSRSGEVSPGLAGSTGPSLFARLPPGLPDRHRAMPDDHRTRGLRIRGRTEQLDERSPLRFCTLVPSRFQRPCLGIDSCR